MPFDFKFRMTTSGPFSAFVNRERDVLAIAVSAGVTAGTEGAKLELRQGLAAAGLGTRLGNAIGSEVYPKGRPSLGAAGTIFPRGESAERILTAFSEGATIVAHGHPYLAIPTENCPRISRGGRAGTRAMTPQEVERRFDADLHILPSRRRRDVYVLAIRAVRGRNGRGVRPATVGRLRGSRSHAGRAAEMIAMFVLVRQVDVRKRIAADAIVQRWGDRIPDLIERALPRD